jgi:hypothetical protein
MEVKTNDWSGFLHLHALTALKIEDLATERKPNVRDAVIRFYSYLRATRSRQSLPLPIRTGSCSSSKVASVLRSTHSYRMRGTGE